MEETLEFSLYPACMKVLDDFPEMSFGFHMDDIASEMEAYGIISPPEQVWFTAAKIRRIESRVSIKPQHQIEQFRVDFLLDPFGFFHQTFYQESVMKKVRNLLPGYVIEIDGFEWHDKTPEQAENDRRRERFITQKGYRVLRYSAREVFRDPMATVEEGFMMALGDIESVYLKMFLMD